MYGDLPVLTFGNWVLKAEWLSGLWNYMYVFYVFLRFFQNPKKHDFLRFFELLHTFSPTVVHSAHLWRVGLLEINTQIYTARGNVKIKSFKTKLNRRIG